jgi:hypothetical protein
VVQTTGRSLRVDFCVLGLLRSLIGFWVSSSSMLNALECFSLNNSLIILSLSLR